VTKKYVDTSKLSVREIDRKIAENDRFINAMLRARDND